MLCFGKPVFSQAIVSHISVSKTSHPVHLRTSPFSSNHKEIQMCSSLFPFQTQLRAAILKLPVHMEGLAAVDHHLFLVFLHTVCAVFAFQIISGMRNKMQYPTCCWLLLLSWQVPRECSDLFTSVSKETETGNARFFDNSATVLGSGPGLTNAAATRDRRD